MQGAEGARNVCGAVPVLSERLELELEHLGGWAARQGGRLTAAGSTTGQEGRTADAYEKQQKKGPGAARRGAVQAPRMARVLSASLSLWAWAWASLRSLAWDSTRACEQQALISVVQAADDGLCELRGARLAAQVAREVPPLRNRAQARALNPAARAGVGVGAGVGAWARAWESRARGAPGSTLHGPPRRVPVQLPWLQASAANAAGRDRPLTCRRAW